MNSTHSNKILRTHSASSFSQLACILGFFCVLGCLKQPIDAFAPQKLCIQRRQLPEAILTNKESQYENKSIFLFSPNTSDNNDGEITEGKNPLTGLTDGLIQGFQSNVNQLTGKSQYEFGDLSRWLDRQAKDGIQQIDQKAKAGILELDQAAKAKVCAFTNKPTYQVGDISKEIFRRLLEGEYSSEDIWLFLKIVAVIGLNIKPLAAVLPVKVVMELLEVSTAQALGDRVVGALSGELESRLQQWMILGDKESIATLVGSNVNVKGLSESGQKIMLSEFARRAMVRVTGKEDYQIGDVARAILPKEKPSSDDQDSISTKPREVEPSPNSAGEVQAYPELLPPTIGNIPNTVMPVQNSMEPSTNYSPAISSSNPMEATSTNSQEAMDPSVSALEAFQAWDAQYLRDKRQTAASSVPSQFSNSSPLGDRAFEEWDAKLLEASYETAAGYQETQRGGSNNQFS